MDEQNHDIFLFPTIRPEDISQEVELVHLETGLPYDKISRRVIARRLQKQERAVLTTFENEINYSPLWQEPSFTEAQIESIYTLLEWASDKSPEVQRQLNRFLEEPNQANLIDTLSLLQRVGLIKRVRKSKRARARTHTGPTSLTQLIVRALKAQSRHAEELYELARINSTAERPEAAVRQALRRLIKKNMVSELGGVYSWIL